MGLIAIDRDVRRDIVGRGFAWIPRAAWSIAPQLELPWKRLCEDWDHLELDRHLAQGAQFRRRRYGRYYWSPAAALLAPLPHEPYFQPQDENVYAGGVVRHFAGLLPDSVHNSFLDALVRAMFARLPVPDDKRARPWEVRVHQIRIVATPEEPGLPAPEGIHQDGTDFLTLHLVRRHNIRGGKTTIYDRNRTPIQRYTMREEFDALILEDTQIMHGVTPVFPVDSNGLGTRDVLGLDFIYSPNLQQPD
jgi:hypothetical protein